MLPIEYYDVRISYSENVVVSGRTNSTTVSLNLVDDYSRSVTVNITVVDVKGQRSKSTVTTYTITIDKHNTTTGKGCCTLYIHNSYISYLALPHTILSKHSYIHIIMYIRTYMARSL